MLELLKRRDVQRLYFAAVAFCVLVYGFDLFVFTFTIDEEMNMFYTTDHLESGLVSQGRWAAFLINRLLLGHIPVPVVPIILTIAFLSAAYALLAVTWDRRIGARHYAAIPFAVGYPTLLHIFSFADFNYIVAIGMLLTSISAFALATNRRLAMPAAVGCFTVTSGIYQPLLVFALVAILLTSALVESSNRQRASLFLKLVIALVIGYLISTGINAVWRAIRGLGSAYVDAFFRFDLLVADPLQAIGKTAALAFGLLAGTDPLFPTAVPVLGITLSLAFVACLWAYGATRGLSLALIIMAVAGASAMPIVNFGSLPYRTMIGLPLALSGIIFAAFDLPARAWRLGLIGLSAYCGLQFALVGNLMNYSAYTSWLRDRETASLVIYRIQKDTDAPPGARVEFAGMPSFDPSPLRPHPWASLGGSFLQADGGNPKRIRNFLGLMGFESATIENTDRLSIYEQIETLPNWPKDGSVSEIDGVVVVKFSDYTTHQRGYYGLPPAE